MVFPVLQHWNGPLGLTVALGIPTPVACVIYLPWLPCGLSLSAGADPVRVLGWHGAGWDVCVTDHSHGGPLSRYALLQPHVTAPPCTFQPCSFHAHPCASLSLDIVTCCFPLPDTLILHPADPDPTRVSGGPSSPGGLGCIHSTRLCPACFDGSVPPPTA